MRSRVMPGSLVTMARRVPVKRLKSVDLPTLGRPTMTRDGSWCAISLLAGRTTAPRECCAIFQCSAFQVARVEGCPGISYRYQGKGFTKIAFRKCLILEEMTWASKGAKSGIAGKKRG